MSVAYDRAWAAADLVQVPTLYQPEIPADTKVKALVFLAGLTSAGGQYAQLNPDAPPLAGKVEPDIITSPDDFKNFVAQMSYQHVDAYFRLMGIEVLSGELDHVRESAQLLGPQGRIADLEMKVARRTLMAARNGHLLI